MRARMSLRSSPFGWSGRRDLNTRPSAPKADALPDCATPRPAGVRYTSPLRTARTQIACLADVVKYHGMDPVARPNPQFLGAAAIDLQHGADGFRRVNSSRGQWNGVR